jgi:hypothetical protein
MTTKHRFSTIDLIRRAGRAPSIATFAAIAGLVAAQARRSPHAAE